MPDQVLHELEHQTLVKAVDRGLDQHAFSPFLAVASRARHHQKRWVSMAGAVDGGDDGYLPLGRPQLDRGAATNANGTGSEWKDGNMGKWIGCNDERSIRVRYVDGRDGRERGAARKSTALGRRRGTR